MTRPVTIVGAGLAGSLLATLLAQRGHSVTAYESRPDVRTTDIDAGRSINLALAARGIAGLERVDVMDRVRPLLTPMRGRMVHDLDGSVELQPYGIRPDEVIYSVGRSELNAALLDAAEEAGAVVHFGHRCRGGSLTDRTLRLEVEGDERDVSFTTVVGADGFNSPVRTMLVESGVSAVTVEMLDHGYKELTLPTDDEGRPRLATDGLHIWPRGGFMLIALPNLDGSFTSTLFLPHQPNGAEPSFATLRSNSDVRRFFAEQFPDFYDLHPDVAGEYAEHPIGDLGTVYVDGWHFEDRAVILGDAAHAIVPFHGQGMNAAFESCGLLIDALDDAPHDWEAAFAAFERTRKPDTDAIAEMALDNYLEMRSQVASDEYLRKRALALRLAERRPDRFSPRYSMVMFSTMPYADARRRARRQDEILEHVLGAGDVDYELADRLIDEMEAL